MLEEITEAQHQQMLAYVAELEAEDARKEAAGEPRFSAILDQIRDDDSEFAAAMGEGYLSFYDKRASRPEMTAQAVYAWLTEYESEHSPEWQAGFIAGWFAAFGENEPSFFWQSDPPPAR